MLNFLTVFLVFVLVCLAVFLLVLGNRPSRSREVGDLRGGLASTKSRAAACSNPTLSGFAGMAEMAAYADDADGGSSLFQPLGAALRRSWAWFLLGVVIAAAVVAIVAALTAEALTA